MVYCTLKVLLDKMGLVYLKAFSKCLFAQDSEMPCYMLGRPVYAFNYRSQKVSPSPLSLLCKAYKKLCDGQKTCGQSLTLRKGCKCSEESTRVYCFGISKLCGGACTYLSKSWNRPTYGRKKAYGETIATGTIVKRILSTKNLSSVGFKRYI